ncbi:ATP-binding cassette domain-containing protein [uncultured Jannaschia sp.]|uniref:ATP-binding cassette domain-containing protein n=1 Tax=uncultured Jannaschia sp. TaxID=293347 RepID=UPI002609223C|nr:ATP-binding cassette domain-containing protein [uncultured Jannaschia sp.]
MTPIGAGSSVPLLRLKALKKSYGAVHALRGVDLDVGRGETVALVGDNGAGKSTLVKLISGAIQPTSGEMEFDGKPMRFASTDAARAHGIETVYQDLGLCNNLTVAENVFLGREHTVGRGPFRFLAKREMRRRTAEALQGLTINVPSASASVAGLSGGQRQAVSLARTKLWSSSLVLLDEPTAALGVQETKRAMEAVRHLQADGVSIVLITHQMPMALEMANRVVVLRQGTKVGDLPIADVTGDDLVALITGARDRHIEAA